MKLGTALLIGGIGWFLYNRSKNQVPIKEPSQEEFTTPRQKIVDPGMLIDPWNLDLTGQVRRFSNIIPVELT